MLEKTKTKITLVCFLLAVLSAFCAVFSLTGKAFAEEPHAEPSVYAEDKTVTQGNGVYLYVYAKDFVNVAGLDLFVRYDGSAFTPGSVSKGGFLSGTLGDVNAAV